MCEVKRLSEVQGLIDRLDKEIEKLQQMKTTSLSDMDIGPLFDTLIVILETQKMIVHQLT